VIADLGSGMNYKKKGLKRLLEAILAGEVAQCGDHPQGQAVRLGAELDFRI
jgi:putative resolvase